MGHMKDGEDDSQDGRNVNAYEHVLNNHGSPSLQVGHTRAGCAASEADSGWAPARTSYPTDIRIVTPAGMSNRVGAREGRKDAKPAECVAPFFRGLAIPLLLRWTGQTDLRTGRGSVVAGGNRTSIAIRYRTSQCDILLDGPPPVFYKEAHRFDTAPPN